MRIVALYRRHRCKQHQRQHHKRQQPRRPQQHEAHRVHERRHQRLGGGVHHRGRQRRIGGQRQRERRAPAQGRQKAAALRPVPDEGQVQGDHVSRIPNVTDVTAAVTVAGGYALCIARKMIEMFKNKLRKYGCTVVLKIVTVFNMFCT